MMKSLLGLIVATAMLTSARTQSPDAVPKFVQTGNDLLLDLDAEVPDDFLLLKWKVNNTDIVRYTLQAKLVLPEYRNRIELTNKKYSVILKNLQEADNGVYTAQLTTLNDGERQLAEYEVKVQDPVSPVQLKVVQVVSDVTNFSCNLTVSCRTTQSPLHVINGTFTCVNQTCSQGVGDGSEVTTSGSFLEVYLSSGSIICRHSNNVSEETDNKTIDGVCRRVPGILFYASTLSPGAVAGFGVFGSLAVLGSVVLVIFLIRRQRRRNRNTENVENTIYSTPQVVARPPAEKEDDSNSTYCKVGQHLTPVELAAMRPPDVLPESCYATVNKR